MGGIHVSGHGVVTLQPGVYYLQGGGFSVAGQASVSGSGVLLVNAPGNTGAGISLSGPSSVTLSAANNLAGAYAPYSGIVVFQDRTSAAPFQMSGPGTVNLTGTVYAARAPLTIAGSGVFNDSGDAAHGFNGAVIVYDVNVNGDGGLTINAAGNSGFGQSSPTSGGPQMMALAGGGGGGTNQPLSFSPGPGQSTGGAGSTTPPTASSNPPRSGGGGNFTWWPQAGQLPWQPAREILDGIFAGPGRLNQPVPVDGWLLF
jgi:hypothetical protein